MSQADTEVDDEIESPEVAEQEPEEAEQEQSEPAEEGAEPEAESGDVVVTIGEESPPQEEHERAPEWVRELRKRNQETVKENRELKKRLESLEAAPAGKPVVLGDKPTLEACEYDTDAFEQKLEQWHEQKRVVAEQERKKQEDGAKAQQAWQSTLDNYGKAKASLKVGDYEEAEFSAQEILSVTQQGVILSGAENPAIVVYALGKNPKKAKELASITDPVKFAFAVAKLETQMKVAPRKTAPLPESTVKGSARTSGSDETLDRLREKAAKTGDMSPVIAYRQQMKAKKQA